MTVADASRNCDVKAKKTIIRWAEAEGIKEVYARTVSNTIERAVPVEWVHRKMQERSIQTEPVFERVEVAANVSFDAPGGKEGGEMLPDTIRALPELAQIVERFARLYEEHTELVESFVKDSKGLTELVHKSMEHEHKQHEATLSGVLKNQKAQYALIGGILLFVLVGIGWGVYGLFTVRDDTLDRAKGLAGDVKKDLSKQISEQSRINDELRLKDRQAMEKLAAEVKTARERETEATSRMVRMREEDLKAARELLAKEQVQRQRLEDELRAVKAGIPPAEAPPGGLPK
mgnify:CR=1 FL=1